MTVDWLRNAVVYSVGIESFADGDGDGWGDFDGIIGRLYHLEHLGVDCLWLSPVHPSPRRDDGYDVADHFGIDARLGDEASFARLVDAAHGRGMRILMDLVANHTSDQHPWYQDARRSPESQRRGSYIWREEPDRSLDVQPVFPGVNDDPWTFDDSAGAWRLARFYQHEPELDTGDDAVIGDIEAILAFWLDRGVDGFRIDAAPFLVQKAGWRDPSDGGQWVLRRLAAHVRRIDPDAALIGEADVSAEHYDDYFAGGKGVDGLFDFHTNNHLFLALATGSAEPLRRCMPEHWQIPNGTLLHWVRSHDELDLEQLAAHERAAVLRELAPREDEQIYGRGIRRRLPPMVDDDRRRIELAHAIVCSLPGAVVVRYGEEIGMGDDLEQPERLAVRTTMQWTGDADAGFSTSPPDRWAHALIDRGPFSNRARNVAEQAADERSLLAQYVRMLAIRRSLPEIGTCRVAVLDAPESVLLLCYEGERRTVMTAHNLSDRPVEVALPSRMAPVDLIRAETCPRRDVLTLGPYGSSWLTAPAVSPG
ncbi:MAG: maltose alpha-D-glucosyltransferase / alpha-amylase [Actinomycetota bacterium]|jgi:maltose alpha-D-glucosyltransferase/alpha-amylase